MSYRFRCVEHGDSDEPDREPRLCWCGRRKVRVYVAPHIAVAARPTSASPEAVAAVEREARWNRDIPAYKRLRKNGVQPKSVDGSARVEAEANTTLDVKLGRTL